VPAKVSGEQPAITDDDLAKLIASVDAAAAAAGTAGGMAAGAGLTDEQRMAQVQTLLAERTDDLQRLQAEYVNYKRRVDRDRTLARQQGAESVVRELVPVLDAMHHAQEAEAELPEGVRLMMAEMARVAGNLGLETFGAPGDEFDPTAHEALYQVPTSDYPEMTLAQVVQPGYRLNGTVIRPARVAVAVEPS
jgi:molecular chaperone GrpE